MRTGLGRVHARVGAALVALLLALATLVPLDGSAYQGQNPFSVDVSGPGHVVRCDRDVVLTATIINLENDKPAPFQAVHWDITRSQSSHDRLSALTTYTNRKGRTSVTLTFGLVAGTRRVRATAARVKGNVVVQCAGGLPVTSPDRLDLDALLIPPGSLPSVEAPARRVAGHGDPGIEATRLRIPHLGLDIPVVEGDGVDVPLTAAAHYPGTAWPGAGSNVYLYAHARTGLFRDLWRLMDGDRLIVDLADGGQVTYEVTDIVPLAAWDALEYLAPTASEQLTLQTCLSYDETAPRFIVISRPVQVSA